MEWIHRFIAGFGGDPSNVTLFGESTGAADILSHLASSANQSKPLFHRAIVQSAIIESTPDLRTAQYYLSRIMSSLGVSTLDQLRAVDPEKLVSIEYPMRATDDGVFFRAGWKESTCPRDPNCCYLLPENGASSPRIPLPITRSTSRHASLSPVRSRAMSRSQIPPANPSHQPLIIGDCANESFPWSGPASHWNTTGVVRRLNAICQSLSKATALFRGYEISPQISHEDLVERVLELINDARVAWPTDCVAECAKRERDGKNVWRYVFDQEGPTRGVPHHGADLIYLFDNVPFSITLPSSPSDSELYFNDDPLEQLQDMEELKLKLQEDTLSDSTGISDEAEERWLDEEDDWPIPTVDDWNYNRVRDAMQERWICFAHGESPWNEDNVYVFVQREKSGKDRRPFLRKARRQTWKSALEPLGMPIVQKVV
jgi:hypothetical protein